jgi:phage terminase small subunit
MPPKQNRFVEEFLVDLNATQAAIRAGYEKRPSPATKVCERLSGIRKRLTKDGSPTTPSRS